MTWPDWTGQTVLIAASGPSQRREDIEAARGKARVVVVNDTWRLAPWADWLYACDWAWWLFPGKAPAPGEFDGERILGKLPTNDDDLQKVTGAQLAFLKSLKRANVGGRERMIFEGDSIGGGANSGFQALNLVVRCGCRRVILTGFDFKDPGNHHHGQHPAGLTQASKDTVQTWIDCMKDAAPELAARGVEVLNATRETALTCFPRVNLGRALG